VTGTLEISRVAVTPPASVHRRLVFLKTINPRSLSGCQQAKQVELEVLVEEMEVARMCSQYNPAFLYLIAFPVLLARATAKTADETTQLELATKAHAHDLLRLAHHQAARGERAGAPPLAQPGRSKRAAREPRPLHGQRKAVCRW